MSDPWMPGIIRDPGTGADYNAGLNRMYMAVDHSTQGTNSIAICRDGRPGYNSSLCNMLFPKEGPPHQFAEINAKTYHAGSAQYGDYNPDGPGFEVERLYVDGQWEDLTPDQIHWLHEAFTWCESEWGLPFHHYWGPDFAAWSADFNGHVNHSQIHPNNDGFSPEEWDLIVNGGTPAPPPMPPKEDELMEVVVLNAGADIFSVNEDGKLMLYHTDVQGKVHSSLVTANANKNHRIITKIDIPGTDDPILFLQGPAGQPVKVQKNGFVWEAKYV